MSAASNASSQATASEKESTKPSSQTDEDELERLAVEALLEEAKRGKVRADQVGPTGWQKCNAPKANKRFLSNMLIGTVSSNKRKLRPEVPPHESSPPLPAKRHKRSSEDKSTRRSK